MLVASICYLLLDICLPFCLIFRIANTIMYLRSLKAYCRCAASFCYSFKLELCFIVRCCWSSFGLEMLQDVVTTKCECQFILHLVDIFGLIKHNLFFIFDH
ncbi:hypothetical protein RYX36_016750 [Vicia faba]